MTDFGPNPGSRVGRKKSTGGGSSSITIGTTPIVGGTTTRILYDNAAKVGELATTGSGNVVLATSATLVTPALGTPSALVLTNATALPAAQVAVGALANGITATTQSAADNSTKLATTAYVDAGDSTTWKGIAPGRLSLTSAVAVQAADVVAGTTIYYVPYIHDQVPVLGLTLGTGVSLALAAGSQLSGKLYDLFLANHSGTLVLGTGPAWSSTSARGSGAGTTQIDQSTVAGVWTNTVTMTLTYDATPHTLSAAPGAAIYVGTMYASGNGQCTCQFNPAAAAGGSNTIVGIFNTYNRVLGGAFSADSTASWTYATNTWRAQNASNSNRISYVDGLAVLCVMAGCNNLVLGNSAGGQIGAVQNSTSAVPKSIGFGLSTGLVSLHPMGTYSPVLGLNYIQSVETAQANPNTFYGFNTPDQDNSLIMALEI